MPPPPPRILRAEPVRPRGLEVRVHLEGEEEPLRVTLEALERARLGVGDALDPTRRRALLEHDRDVRVRDAALHLLAHRARTRRELERRLRRKGFETGRVDACLDRLEARGLLDDAAVAAAFVRDRLRHRPRGRARLADELRERGVPGELAERVIEGVLEDAGTSDAELALRVAEDWVRRQAAALLEALAAGRRDPGHERARRRLVGYLVRRGFRGGALRAAEERA